MPDSLLHVASGRFRGLCPSHLLSAFSMESRFLCVHDSNRVNVPTLILIPTLRTCLGCEGGRTLLCVGVHRTGLIESPLTCKHLSESSRYKDIQPPASSLVSVGNEWG